MKPKARFRLLNQRTITTNHIIANWKKEEEYSYRTIYRWKLGGKSATIWDEYYNCVDTKIVLRFKPIIGT